MHVTSPHVTIWSQRLLSYLAFQPFHYDSYRMKVIPETSRAHQSSIRFYYYHPVDTSAGGL